ncbi:MAG: chemotaxis response regulator protein-glutamate methylesterase [Gemmatimonadales bacterium]
MSRIRVLVVDDAVVVRRLVSDALASDPEIEVVGTAANGRIALAKLDQINPDVVTLDIEMPELDGLGTLRELRKLRPHLPVIMCSTLTERGGSATLDALALGANDYVTKPHGYSNADEALARLRDQLVPKVKALGLRAQQRSAAAPTVGVASRRVAMPVPRPPLAPAAPGGRLDVLTIGVSTGGPNALAALIPMLPADLPVPVLIVQHMPPLFTRLLADRLNGTSKLQVREAVAGAVVEPGTVWIAPGDQHMEVVREKTRVVIRLHDGPPENSCRPAVDVLFRSVAQVYGAGTLGVILTGMGRDGVRGAEAIREFGGRVLAQDEASSVVWGMPGYVANAGLAEAVLPLSEMAQGILRRLAAGRVTRPIVAGSV